ncbi:MAG TPA: nitrilase-related carbon-nitrogen hydrolase [Tepidisphaeraceae bacterium]|jgi:predicted amidohydrolase
MRVHLIQPDTAWHDRAANHAKAAALVAAAKPAAGDLLVLPEMFAVGFSMDVAAAVDADGQTEQFLAGLAAQYDASVIGGNVIRPDARGRNVAEVFAGRRKIARYAKIHPFGYAGETDHYAGGDGVCVFPLGDFTAAAFVCYDLRFPEIFRAATAGGAELLVVIANWPAARVAHWLALLTARAIENQAYVVGVNRAGRDPNVAYPGRSVVIDPRGVTVADAGEAEGFVTARLDRAALCDYRRHFPALADARFVHNSAPVNGPLPG